MIIISFLSRKLPLLGLVLLFLTSANVLAEQYVRYDDGSGVYWGELVDGTIHQLSAAPYLGGQRTGKTAARQAVKLKAPVEPKLVVMTALNFRSHIRGEPAAYPGLFIVPASSIIGPEESIVQPPDSTRLDYEAEAVVVIGKRADNVPEDKAHEYIFGVTAGDDVTDRAWQQKDLQWVRAKGSKTFNPVGPVLVTGLNYLDLNIEGRLNGEKRQGGRSSDMVFNFNHMVSYISRYMVLEPGDLIWSGTMGITRGLKAGDVYEVEIEGVGVLRNPVVKGE